MLDADAARGAKFGIGQPTPRREDDRLLRGAGEFVDDIVHEGQLHGAFLRAAEAHATLKSVDVEAARAAPGVRAVYTGADLERFNLAPIGNALPFKSVDGSDTAPVTQPHLARGAIRYVGEPIAFVVAESRAEAVDAAALIEVDTDALTPVVDAEDALKDGAPALHDAAPGNRSYVWETGDATATDAAFARAAKTVTVRVRNQRVIVWPVEPRAINATYDAASERWTIHCVSQGSHGMRNQIAKHLQVEPARVRVITPDVGGGFGMKLMVHPEYALVAAAARELGRPVKWTADRTESFLSDAGGRDLWTDADAAFAENGALIAMRSRSVSNLGAYYSQVGACIHAMFSAPLLGGMYRLDAAHARVVGAFTTTTPTDAYRGAGRPEVIYVTERLMEAGARAFGEDPATFRLKSLLTPEDMPFTQPCGAGVYDSGDCANTLRKALAAADHAGLAARKAQARAAGKLLGFGACYYMERTGGGPNETAELRIADGKIDVAIGTQSTGQGHETAWTQLICDALGVAPEALVFHHGDSDKLTAVGGTGGSRSLIMAHRVFALAAEDAIEKGREAAAAKLEAAVADIEFEKSDGGRFRIAGTDRTISLFDAAEAADGGAIIALGGVSDRESTFPNGAHVAEILVDPRTGETELAAYTIVDDFGAVLNPLLVVGQVHGGVVQGVGQALYEGAVYDAETGQPLTGSLMDYQLPRAADFPFFDFELTPNAPAKTNPMGVKGCGEAGAVAGIPAATLAVYDALHEIGAPEPETPLTPLKIWEAIQAATEPAA